jgi:hypothetical protein
MLRFLKRIGVLFASSAVDRSSLKQQSADRDVAPPGHIILILVQPVFALSL